MRLLTYAEAVARWTAAGCPTRSKEDTEEIFRVLCFPCGMFDRPQRRCRECGCRVSPVGPAILNKIKMATEHCPLGRW